MFQNDIEELQTQEVIKLYIDEFNTSDERTLMMKGEKYYKAENDILDRVLYRFEDEVKVADETKTNHRLSHGIMHGLVEDKVNYLLSKPFSIICDDEKYLDAVQSILGKRFQKTITRLGVEASNKGIAWLHVYIDASGKFKTMKIPSEQIIPLWTNNDHEELQALIRYYTVETYEGRNKSYVTKVEYWTPDSVYYYLQDTSGNIIVDAEKYLNDGTDAHFEVNGSAGSWGKVPFIPFKNNDHELPDLQFIKTLVDDYDLSRSDISNMLTEIKDIIFALRGYGGESLSDFMRDLSYYKAVKLDDDGGIDKIEHTINIDAAEKHYTQLRHDIFSFGQGVDKDADKLGNSPSGIALKFLYSGLDLKCNALEDNFKWSFEELITFVNVYLGITNQYASDKEVSIIFNRDIAINESATIADCQNSTGIISNETVISMHPWVKDVQEELDKIKQEDASDEVPMLGGTDTNGVDD